MAQAGKIMGSRTAQDSPIHGVFGPVARADKFIPLPSVHDASQMAATSGHCSISISFTIYNNVLVKCHSLWEVQG